MRDPSPSFRDVAANLKAGVGSTGGQIKADAALLSAVNDARLHPEKYPPKGKTPVNGVAAKLTPCPKPLGKSWALDTAAATHSRLISTVSQRFPHEGLRGPPEPPAEWPGLLGAVANSR